MALFMDVHNIEGGVSAADVAAVTISISPLAEVRQSSGRGVDIQPIEQIFDSAGNSTDGEVVGTSKLIRRDSSMMAIAHVAGLTL